MAPPMGGHPVLDGRNVRDRGRPCSLTAGSRVFRRTLHCMASKGKVRRQAAICQGCNPECSYVYGNINRLEPPFPRREVTDGKALKRYLCQGREVSRSFSGVWGC